MGVIIIGGGIVGLATALQLTRRYQSLPGRERLGELVGFGKKGLTPIGR